MENRAAYGPTIDLASAGLRPNATELMQVAQHSGEFAVAHQAGRWYSLRMVPAARTDLRLAAVDPTATHLVLGGTKVRMRL